MTIIHVFILVCLFLPFRIKVYFMHSHIIFSSILFEDCFLLYHMRNFTSSQEVLSGVIQKKMQYYFALFFKRNKEMQTLFA